MKLISLTLTNWGPFRGEQTIDLTVSDSAPVILFHGENMRGKTSLLRAIVWCLYGKLRNQDGRTDLPLAQMVNVPELAQFGEAVVGVVLDFEHRGQRYELRRHAKATEDGVQGVFLSDYRTTLLPHDGNPYPEERISDVINSILNYEVADFFFFDGEMLSRFEERLRDDRSGTQQFVRNQVERALGLPFLRTLESDLDELRKNIDGQIQKALRADQRATSLIQRYKELENTENRQKADLVALKKRHDLLEGSLADVDKQLAGVESIKELYYERKALETEVEQRQGEIQRLKEEARAHQDIHWWFPLARQFEAERSRTLTDLQQAFDLEKKRNQLAFRLSNAESRLANRACPTCHQVLPKESEDEVRKEITAISCELSTLTVGPDVDKIGDKSKKLAKFASAISTANKVVQTSKDIRKAQMIVANRQLQIQRINDDLQNNTVDISVLESQRSSIKEDIVKSNLFLRTATNNLAVTKAEQKKLSSEIAKNPKVPALDRTRLDFTELALDIVKGSFDDFSETMRIAVESKASNLFRALTTEPQYTGVAISKDYTIRVLNSTSSPVDLISAGGNQVLTMSFIGALAECSAELAPMVMDTPFGRLDVGHREAILRWVSGLETQTIMFVQSGEYSSARDRPILGSRVGREYRIERISEQESKVSVA